MGVYVVNKQRPWYGNIGVNLGKGLFDILVGGMFDRAAKAKEVERNRKIYSNMADAMSPHGGYEAPGNMQSVYDSQYRSPLNVGGLYDSANVSDKALGGSQLDNAYNMGATIGDVPQTQSAPVGAANDSGWSGIWNSTQGLGAKTSGGNREDMLRVFGKYGVTPDEAKGLYDMYANRFKNADTLEQGDAIRRRTGDLNFNVREDPNAAMQSSMIAQAYGLKPEDVMKYTYPNMKADNFDAGNREVVYGFDPATGKFTDQSYDYGINPTDKYKADADTEQANIGANADLGVAGINARSRDYATDMGYKGRKYTADMGYKGRQLSSAGGAKPAKALTLSDKKNLDAMTANAIQLAVSTDDLKNRLSQIAGNNVEAQQYVQSIASAPKYQRKNEIGIYQTADNPYAGQGQAQPTVSAAQVAAYKAKFPKYKNMPDEQVAKHILAALQQ